MYAEYANEIELDQDYQYCERGERFSDIPLPPVMNVLLFAGWIVISLIGFAVTFLAKNPVALKNDIRRIEGAKDNLYRLRVGSYRVIFKKQKEQLLIIIVRVGHRREIYLDL